MSDGTNDSTIRERKKHQLIITETISIGITESISRWGASFEITEVCPWIGWYGVTLDELKERVLEDIQHTNSVNYYLSKKK
jgi:hypothetical protein